MSRRKFHIRHGDKVVVTTGTWKDKVGEVLEIRDNGDVIVKGVNEKLTNLKRSKDAPKGGQIRKEFPVDISNLMLWDAELKKGVKTRIEGEGRAKKRVSIVNGKVVGE
jgi:large subunit ribosomal protein L24